MFEIGLGLRVLLTPQMMEYMHEENPPFWAQYLDSHLFSPTHFLLIMSCHMSATFSITDVKCKIQQSQKPQKFSIRNTFLEETRKLFLFLGSIRSHETSSFSHICVISGRKYLYARNILVSFDVLEGNEPFWWFFFTELAKKIRVKSSPPLQYLLHRLMWLRPFFLSMTSIQSCIFKCFLSPFFFWFPSIFPSFIFFYCLMKGNYKVISWPQNFNSL